MTTPEQELRLTQQELAESKRNAEELAIKLDTSEARNEELNIELATLYRTTEPMIRDLKSLMEIFTSSETQELKEQLAKCHEMLNKQQAEEKEKVHELQQQHGIVSGQLQSKNHELKTQLEEKEKELLEAKDILDEKEKFILEGKSCEADLRLEVQTVSAKKEQSEKNFEKISAELNKARTEKKAALDGLERCKVYIEKMGRNCKDFVKNIVPGSSPVLQMKRTPSDANQHEQENPTKRSKRN